MLHKEYRIVLPVSVEEYRCAQVYMTSRTSLMEAMDSDGAGVEILANRPAEHHTLGPCQYTKKVFHIDKRFPSWLRMIAPKSGSYLLEESWNAYPSTITEVTFPMFTSFRILVESHHLPDRGERFVQHCLSSSCDARSSSQAFLSESISSLHSPSTSALSCAHFSSRAVRSYVEVRTFSIHSAACCRAASLSLQT